MSVLITELQESLYTRLFSAGYLTVDQWWKETDLLRGFWRLYLNAQDGVTLELAGKSFALPAGRLVVVPPGLDFEIQLEQPVEQLFAHFEFLGWPPEAARDLLPEPMVLPPSRMANFSSSSMATGVFSSTLTVTLSPGMTISAPPRRLHEPVTSVVRK